MRDGEVAKGASQGVLELDMETWQVSPALIVHDDVVLGVMGSWQEVNGSWWWEISPLPVVFSALRSCKKCRPVTVGHPTPPGRQDGDQYFETQS